MHAVGNSFIVTDCMYTRRCLCTAHACLASDAMGNTSISTPKLPFAHSGSMLCLCKRRRQQRYLQRLWPICAEVLSSSLRGVQAKGGVGGSIGKGGAQRRAKEQAAEQRKLIRSLARAPVAAASMKSRTS